MEEKFTTEYLSNGFEIIGATESEGKGFSNGLWISETKITQPQIKGQKIYKRLFIKRRKIK